jgi:hypothetical protein
LPLDVYILHFEDLARDFECLMRTFGMNWTWPSLKRNVGHGHLTVSNLTEQTKALIATYYAADIEAFGSAM